MDSANPYKAPLTSVPADSSSETKFVTTDLVVGLFGLAVFGPFLSVGAAFSFSDYLPILTPSGLSFALLIVLLCRKMPGPPTGKRSVGLFVSSLAAVCVTARYFDYPRWDLSLNPYHQLLIGSVLGAPLVAIGLWVGRPKNVPRKVVLILAVTYSTAAFVFSSLYLQTQSKWAPPALCLFVCLTAFLVVFVGIAFVTLKPNVTKFL